MHALSEPHFLPRVMQLMYTLLLCTVIGIQQYTKYLTLLSCTSLVDTVSYNEGMHQFFPRVMNLQRLDFQ